MTNKEIFNLYEGLSELSQDDNIKFSFQIGYCLAYNKNILEPFYNAITETQEKIIKKYGTKIEEGWTVPKENLDEFQKEWSEFMSIENEILPKKVKLKDIDTKIGLKLIDKLLPIIEE